MTTRKKALIIGGIILFLLLLFLLIWFLLKQKPTTTVVVTQPANTVTAPPRDSETVTPPVEENVDVSLKSLATTFSERYGSYSTETDFANLYDVMALMTASLKTETENFIVSAKAAETYYGITTRVLSVTILSSEAAAGQVQVSTQREESKVSPQNSQIFYQKLLLDCVKEGGVWKVAAATWQ